MAAPSLTYTITNGTTADGSQVQTNFQDLLNGYTDGTKDLSISALTCAGTLTANGHVNLGNSSADDLTITASLASTLAIKTNNTYGIGGSTLGLSGIYLGNGGAGATCRIISASHATTRTYTIPDCSADGQFIMNKTVQTFYDGIKLDDDANQDTLNYYREEDVSNVTFTPTGGSASGTVAIKWTRCGRLVTGFIPQASATAAGGGSANFASSASAVPSWAIPSVVTVIPIQILNNAAATSGVCLVNTDGTLTIRTASEVSFTASANCGLNRAVSISYSVI